jgi:C1A family cysteine protease
MTNYGWFQFQLYRMCDLLVRDKPLAELLAELKTVFRDPTPRPFTQVATQLEAIHHGIGTEMGPLWKPTTMPNAQLKPCSQISSSGKDSDLVVLNSSSKPVKVTAGTDAPVTIASHSWYTFGGRSGVLVQIDTGVCFVFGDEPSIARVPPKQASSRLVGYAETTKAVV